MAALRVQAAGSAGVQVGADLRVTGNDSGGCESLPTAGGVVAGWKKIQNATVSVHLPCTSLLYGPGNSLYSL